MLEGPQQPSRQDEFELPEPDGRRSPFGYKIGWLAFASANRDEIARVADLGRQRPMTWNQGLWAAYQSGAFVCPAVDGWTLMVGIELLGRTRDLDYLSSQLGCEVQSFWSHRVSSAHGWARLVPDSGESERTFGYADGSVLFNTGRATDVEVETAGPVVRAAAGPWPPLDVEPESDQLEWREPDEEDVIAVAATWGLDPTGLDGPDDRLGVWGVLPDTWRPVVR